jgi:hypothetical protein
MNEIIAIKTSVVNDQSALVVERDPVQNALLIALFGGFVLAVCLVLLWVV